LLGRVLISTGSEHGHVVGLGSIKQSKAVPVLN